LLAQKKELFIKPLDMEGSKQTKKIRNLFLIFFFLSFQIGQ
jgi:hypothetical protein